MDETALVSRRILVALLVGMALLVGACGGGDGRAADGDGEPEGELVEIEYAAQVASYDVAVGNDQRLLVGLVGRGTGTVVAFGTVTIDLLYLGTEQAPIEPPERRGQVEATFLPVAGTDPPDADEDQPREVRPSEGLGVYEATGVDLPDAGRWGLQVRAQVDGEDQVVNAGLVVREERRALGPGDAAPTGETPTVETNGLNDPLLDSRASDTEALPDPELHRTTVGAAVAAGLPSVVVVSTPVYCVSQFCGPITDSIADLAARYEDRVAFIHLEVWADFEARKVAESARAWIQPSGTGDLFEPWVFFVGADGIITERLDNVMSDAQLESGVERLLGP